MNSEKKNNIGELKFETKSFSDLIINKYSGIILFNYKSIYKLSKWEYLLVYQVNEFEIKFKNKDKNLINILLIEDLNEIQIYKQDNNEFIYIYKKIERKSKNLFKRTLIENFSSEQDSKNTSFRELRFNSRGYEYFYKDKYYGDSNSFIL